MARPQMMMTHMVPARRIPMDRRTPTRILTVRQRRPPMGRLTLRTTPTVQARRKPPTHSDPQTMIMSMDQVRKTLLTRTDHQTMTTIRTAQAKETTQTLTLPRATQIPMNRTTAIPPLDTATTIPQAREIALLVNCWRRLVVSSRMIGLRRRDRRRDPMLDMTMNKCGCGSVHETCSSWRVIISKWWIMTFGG